MADVAAKIISANNIKTGSISIKTGKKDYQTTTPDPETGPAVTDVETKYTNRFDDPRYYAGDTSS